MNDYELTIASIKYYKDRACDMVDCKCENCEAMYKCCEQQWCCFDTVIRFIEYVNRN